jgi:hypothetical protein
MDMVQYDHYYVPTIEQHLSNIKCNCWSGFWSGSGNPNPSCWNFWSGSNPNPTKISNPFHPYLPVWATNELQCLDLVITWTSGLHCATWSVTPPYNNPLPPHLQADLNNCSGIASCRNNAGGHMCGAGATGLTGHNVVRGLGPSANWARRTVTQRAANAWVG